MRKKCLKICIENNPPKNPNPYQEYLYCLEIITDDLHKTYIEIEMLNKKQHYHFKEFINCYRIVDVYYDAERFIITRIEKSEISL